MMTRTDKRTAGALLLGALVLQGCGKHETTGGTVGAVSGAIVGSAVAGRKDKGTGAILGGIIGNFLGREVMRGADEDVQEERYRRKVAEHQVQQARSNRAAEVTRVVVCERELWCSHCNRRNAIAGARRCTDCGSSLVYEKVCRGCAVSFPPTNPYRYCPYCVDRQYLVLR